MADFVSWQTEYTRAKNAIANRAWDGYFISSVENSREMKTMYTKLGNVMEFIEWLGAKAAQESLGLAEGEIPCCTGGN